MNLNQCNNCGGDYEYRHGRWVCRACGAYKPEEISNEEVTLLYTASQKLRLADFDEAEEAFDDIVRKYPQNPNGYWGRLMSRYGIKYEEDYDGRMIPTCYATSIKSILDDADYKNAIEYADADAREYFKRQAEYIERVRCEWVEKANRERPYDIFICYKDSDLAKGIERTEDSVAAQEIYIHLLEEGYRVFFSRESLRDKVGEKYEPYIFNALSTAKVLLVYGSSAEYIRSTWLKNEWHRYYKKVVAGEKHKDSLIVACEGFSPAKLPTILASRQCFDAKRKTFISDLDRCIKKIMQESPDYSATPPQKDTTVFSGLHEHKYKTKIVKATCIAKGYTVHRCDCGYEYKDAYTSLVDHDYKISEKVEPTCTTDGYESKVCQVCGESTKVTIRALNHQFTHWIEGRHPTCTEEGEAQRQCTRCGAIEARPIEATGHQFGLWISQPEGKQTSHCVHCGQTFQRERIAGRNIYGQSRPPYRNIYAQTNGAQSQTPPKTQADNVISFKEILNNHLLDWKYTYSSKGSPAQKFQQFVKLSFLFSFVLFLVAICMSSSDSIYVSHVGVTSLVWMAVNIILTIFAKIKIISEKSRYKRENLPYPRNQYSRTILKFVSTFLFAFCAFCLAFIPSTQSGVFVELLVAGIFATWGIITSLYAHCPRQYNKIQFAKNGRPVPRAMVWLLGFVLTWIYFITSVVIGSIIGS